MPILIATILTGNIGRLLNVRVRISDHETVSIADLRKSMSDKLSTIEGGVVTPGEICLSMVVGGTHRELRDTVANCGPAKAGLGFLGSGKLWVTIR